MKKLNEVERVAYSMSEAAAKLGKHPTWIYRRAWKGDIAVISQFGRLMVAASELARILSTASVYNPRPKGKRNLNCQEAGA